MSKKTSKILVVAVVAILAVSMLAMVACGEKKGPEGPKALEPATAMKTLQDGFTKADVKSVNEKINVSGIKVELAGLITVWIDNVDINMTRSYNKDGVLNIKATIENLKVKEDGIAAVMNLLKQVIPNFNLNIDSTVIANLSKVKIEAEVDIDPDMVVTTKDFSIYGLDQVKDAKGKQLEVLKDGDGKPLGAVYSPSELVGQTVDPRHESDGTDADGLFTAMDKWSSNEAGTILEDFLKSEYQMVSLYNFTNMTIADTAISSNEETDFSDVYAVAQDVLDGYKDRALVEGKDVTLGGILNKLFGTDQVAKVIPQVAKMGKANMTGTVKADGNTWKLVNMTTKQNVQVTITTDLIGKVVDLLGDFGITLPSIVGGVVSGLEDITTPINVVTTATFNY